MGRWRYARTAQTCPSAAQVIGLDAGSRLQPGFEGGGNSGRHSQLWCHESQSNRPAHPVLGPVGCRPDQYLYAPQCGTGICGTAAGGHCALWTAHC
eukprot:3816705-Amphidinium_carterae.2